MREGSEGIVIVDCIVVEMVDCPSRLGYWYRISMMVVVVEKQGAVKNQNKGKGSLGGIILIHSPRDCLPAKDVRYPNHVVLTPFVR